MSGSHHYYFIVEDKNGEVSEVSLAIRGEDEDEVGHLQRAIELAEKFHQFLVDVKEAQK